MRLVGRRTALKGLGATIALPFLESISRAAGEPPRLVCIEMVYGSAGSTKYGASKNLWAPAGQGREFDLLPTILSPLENLQDYLTIVSGTDVNNAASFSPDEFGADHVRSSAVFLTQCRPKPTLGPDVRAGVSFDQLYASRFGQDTPIPSLQVSIEDTRVGSGFQTGYSNIYRDTISWSSPTTPLPMLNDPRVVFNRLFEVRPRYEDSTGSILDFVASEIRRLSATVGSQDRRRLDEYLTDVREVERRIQAAEEFSRSGPPRAMPEAPGSAPDDFEEHVKIMFDLQVQALASGITRVSAFKMGLDGVPRTFPGSGVDESFHSASHHGENEDKIARFAKINTYHVKLVAQFLERLRSTQEADGNLLDKSLVIYGSPMGDSNFHNHKNCPLLLAGRATGRIKGGLHVKALEGTPMANVMLGLLLRLGCDDLQSFGDSSGILEV
jgi:hypothetical protein